MPKKSSRCVDSCGAQRAEDPRRVGETSPVAHRGQRRSRSIRGQLSAPAEGRERGGRPGDQSAHSQTVRGASIASNSAGPIQLRTGSSNALPERARCPDRLDLNRDSGGRRARNRSVARPDPDPTPAAPSARREADDRTVPPHRLDREGHGAEAEAEAEEEDLGMAGLGAVTQGGARVRKPNPVVSVRLSEAHSDPVEATPGLARGTTSGTAGLMSADRRMTLAPQTSSWSTPPWRPLIHAGSGRVAPASRGMTTKATSTPLMSTPCTMRLAAERTERT
jgi:hypothetical protein